MGNYGTIWSILTIIIVLFETGTFNLQAKIFFLEKVKILCTIDNFYQQVI